MKRKHKSKLRKLWQERYFGPLLQTPVDLGYIPIVSIISLLLSIFFYFVAGYNDVIGIIRMFFMILIVINIFSFLIYFIQTIKKIFIKIVAYIFLAFNFIALLFNLVFIGLLLFVSDGSPADANTFYKSNLAPYYIGVMMFLFFMSMVIYSLYYLPKNQGKRWKINQWETYGVGKKDKKSPFKLNFLITLGIVVIVPAFLTGYIQNLFGLFLGVLVTITVTALVVDSFYAAYYSLKHPDYD